MRLSWHGQTLSDYKRDGCNFNPQSWHLLIFDAERDKTWSCMLQFKIIFNLRLVVAQEYKCVTVNATGCRFDPHSRKCNIYLNLNFYFSALVSGQSAALCFITQYAASKSRRKMGNGLSLHQVLCILFCVRDTTWS